MVANTMLLKSWSATQHYHLSAQQLPSPLSHNPTHQHNVLLPTKTSAKHWIIELGSNTWDVDTQIERIQARRNALNKNDNEAEM
mmetsp:Transcript_32826/g.60592  ORF Transcript_32826/g.60592 Transcript_32826/m.60592 type:complete len:84 (-) Transcript_32826:839-1090(-)